MLAQQLAQDLQISPCLEEYRFNIKDKFCTILNPKTFSLLHYMCI